MANQNTNQNYKILIVDANDVSRAILRDIISKSHPVQIADEKNAFDIISDKRNNVGAAVFDIQHALPILKQLRSSIATKTFPVLISTDLDNSSLETELFDLDVVDVLKAPYNATRVLNRIKTALKIADISKSIDELERDELTGLLTRKAFLRKSEKFAHTNPEKNFSIIAFDFDNFKSSNSIYGVEKCNEFLAYTAKEMVKSLPEGIAGRYGGDQYVLFYEPDKTVNVDRLLNTAKRILDTAPIPHQIVKIGVYANVDTDLPLVICCDRAFLAINGIKGKYGKTLAFFEDELQNKLLNEQRIIETMERALEEKQFQVFYQPKHETITGNIAGAEALVRWNHPEYGFMSPSQFIPLFERNGFITKLDTFVLDQVCQDIKRWEQDGLPLVPVSVNVSRRDFMENDCIEKQYQTIDRYGVNHNLLHMEVTESLYSENIELIISQLKRTQELGFMIEMDDFGAGYSSLGLLSTFPLNVLKLDISFIQNIWTNEIIQGFYFSKPLPVREFETYLKKASHISCGKISIELLGNRKDQTVVNPLSEDMLMAANEVSEGIPGGFFAYHADGGLELISFNHELVRMYGCNSAEEFREYVGNSFVGIVHPDDFARVQKSIEKQITEENTIDYVEYRIKAKDGTVKYVKDYGRFVRTKSYGDIFYVFLNDITLEERAKAEAEAELVRKIELQRNADFASNANRAKNIFMYKVSQNILNTMQSIVHLTEDIKKKVADNVDVNVLLKELERAEEHLLGFVNNVYELSLMDNGDLKLVETPTDISHAVERIYDLICDEAKANGVELEYWSEIEYPYIYQDIIHTTNCVMNILLNSIKYTPKGGKIRFGLRQEKSDVEGECTVSFICEDSGIGISKEFLPYICKSFAREDNEVNTEIPSAGLGLSIAKTLLALMNGTIEIKSEIGKGTTVITTQPHRFAKKEDVEKASTLAGNVRT